MLGQLLGDWWSITLLTYFMKMNKSVTWLIAYFILFEVGLPRNQFVGLVLLFFNFLKVILIS